MKPAAHTRAPMTGRGYDEPVDISTLPSGVRFASFTSVPHWRLPDEVQTGTVISPGCGSVQVWWDGEQKPTRCTPALSVYILDEEQLSPEQIEQYGGSTEAMGTEQNTNGAAQLKALVAKINFQYNSLATSVEGEDKAKAAVVMTRIDKLISECRALGLQPPAPPESISWYPPLQETLEEAKVAIDQRKAEREQVEQRKTERAVAIEKHKTAEAESKATSKAAGKAASTGGSKPKGEKRMRPCLDGCGTMVPGNFAMGHDAKLKSLLLKIERGEQPLEMIPEPCLDLVKITKGEQVQELDSQGNAKGEPKQTFRITAAPVRFPGREDISLTHRDD